MIRLEGIAGAIFLLLFVLQFLLICWKTIAIARLQRDITALTRFVQTWGERMLTRTTLHTKE